MKPWYCFENVAGYRLSSAHSTSRYLAGRTGCASLNGGCRSSEGHVCVLPFLFLSLGFCGSRTNTGSVLVWMESYYFWKWLHSPGVFSCVLLQRLFIMTPGRARKSKSEFAYHLWFAWEQRSWSLLPPPPPPPPALRLSHMKDPERVRLFKWALAMFAFV